MLSKNYYDECMYMKMVYNHSSILGFVDYRLVLSLHKYYVNKYTLWKGMYQKLILAKFDNF